ncbi:glutaredoxin [Chaetoceros tenuissimus]|uniref:Glutaredoxin n=1 Tax=Chaetoceros tenuissimus TaxID=426638 RepID=A0AAD3CE58_9STRA|nr:glutaredoxin [Chaetoceros tenuissimus]
MKNLSIISLAALAASASAYAPNPVINVGAKGMSLLKPIFKLEAELQAAALGTIAKIDKEEVINEIQETARTNKALIYTYGLSPFSSEAVAILEGTDYEFTQIELGAEWFLLGGKESVARVAMSEMLDSGATSLPKVFIGGECIGGCAELAELKESGELEAMLSKAGVRKNGQVDEPEKKFFGLF